MLALTVEQAPPSTVAENLGRRIATILGKDSQCVVGVTEILQSVTGEERENVIIHAIANGASDVAIESCLTQLEQKTAAASILKQKGFWIGVLTATASVAAIIGTGVYLSRRRRTLRDTSSTDRMRS